MRYAIDIAPLGDLADPATIVRLAVAAEAAGWDGLSIWDSIGVSMGGAAADPFVTLAAVAMKTEQLSLITSVIVLPRRRPQLVAQAAITLDRVSGGRLVLGVGAGADPGDLDPFGEAASLSDRVARMDAALAVIDPWLRGEPAQLDDVGGTAVTLGPRPIQRPRPPIWLGGMKPGALRRAARWDGWIAIATSDDGSSMALSAEAFGAMVERLRSERATLGRDDGPLDIAVFGFSDPGGAGVVAAYAERGATWWLESLSPMRGSVEELLAVVEAGPPRR
jgi:alkanesulfonate monooxygenase SsuD/methylene tetrahydromethanopterin reductase-like flavin-dependent oxidoreductase (luciferase family)